MMLRKNILCELLASDLVHTFTGHPVMVGQILHHLHAVVENAGNFQYSCAAAQRLGTRILKLGPRRGDGAEEVFLELV